MIGLWVTYASASSRSNRIMSTGGFTLAKVYIIFRLILNSFAIAIMVLVLVLSVLSLNSYSSPGIINDNGFIIFDQSVIPLAMTVIAAVAVVCILIFVFSVVVLGRTLSTVNTAKKTLITGIPNRKVSMLAAIVCFLGAFLFVYMITSTIFSASSYVYENIGTAFIGTTIGVLSQVIYATFYIVSGVSIISYRSKMVWLEDLYYRSRFPANNYQNTMRV